MTYRFVSFILALFILNSCVKYVVQPVEQPVQQPQQNLEQFVIDYAIKKEQIAQRFKDIKFDDRNEIKIALMLPLSGKSEKVGKEILNAVTLALFDNRDPRIVLKVFDTEGSELKTKEITKEIIDTGFQIVIGPVFSQNVSVMKPLIKDHDIFVFTFSNDVTIAGDNIFLLGIDFRQQIQRLVDYTITNEYQYYISLLPANDFGSYAIQELRRSVENKGGVVLKSEFYTQGVELKRNVKRLVNVANESPTDSHGRPIFMTDEQISQYQVKKAENALTKKDNKNLSSASVVNSENSDIIWQIEDDYAPRPMKDYKLVLFVPDSGKILEDTVALLEEYKFPRERVRIVGLSNWYQSPSLKSQVLNGAWFVDIAHDNLKLYEAHYYNNFRTKPTRISTYAYDALAVITSLLAYQEDTSELNNLTITQDIGFNGINGVFKFRPDGISERLLSIYSVRSNGLEQIDSDFSFLDDKDILKEINLD